MLKDNKRLNSILRSSEIERYNTLEDAISIARSDSRIAPACILIGNDDKFWVATPAITEYLHKQLGLQYSERQY